jgi:anti-sigma regulatory factor (Ser/Thr protein kinase)/CheY-like chemotaxis protein
MIDTGYNILIIDKNPEDRTRLGNILKTRFQIDVASSSTEGLNKVGLKPYDLILTDFETIALHVDMYLERLQKAGLKTRMALMTPLPLEEYIKYLRKWGITNVLPKREDYVPEQVISIVENFIDPQKAFGLRRYLPTTTTKIKVRTNDDKPYVISKILNFFGAHGISSSKLYDVRLVLEEMVNNMIYHSFQDEEGNEKYQPTSFVELNDTEQVRVDYAFHNNTAGFAITDNRGILSPETVMETLCKQYDKEGLLAQSGRGFFLSRRFSDSLIINIRKNKNTQIIALFNRNGEEEKDKPISKPFYINYVEEP